MIQAPFLVHTVCYSSSIKRRERYVNGWICEIGKKLGEQPEDFCDYEKILSQEQLQVLEKYLYAFETGVNEKTRHNFEIDFVVSRKNKICPIEVKSSGPILLTHSLSVFIGYQPDVWKGWS